MDAVLAEATRRRPVGVARRPDRGRPHGGLTDRPGRLREAAPQLRRPRTTYDYAGQDPINGYDLSGLAPGHLGGGGAAFGVGWDQALLDAEFAASEARVSSSISSRIQNLVNRSVGRGSGANVIVRTGDGAQAARDARYIAKNDMVYGAERTVDRKGNPRTVYQLTNGLQVQVRSVSKSGGPAVEVRTGNGKLVVKFHYFDRGR